MPEHHFDYIIVGNGLAGLQLALSFNNNSFFKDKKIALIDVAEKTQNDKTWSFWEKETTPLTHLASKRWDFANIITTENRLSLSLKPYSYHSIKSIDFYNYAKNQLEKSNNIQFIIDMIIDVVEEDEKVIVKSIENTYYATHVFDSRIPTEYNLNAKRYTTLIQHFKGWLIKTEEDTFNENIFTKMDYRLKDGNQTTFMYVLPYSKREALVEFTYFTEDIVDESTYDSFIKQYIKEYLNVSEYKIIETEIGQIPMTTYPFYNHTTKNITKIGTAGGWVKPSTGYSFKITQQKVKRIVSNLKHNRLPSERLFKKKYFFYDKVFLQVLIDNNHKGDWIFQEFYRKNKTTTMFRFLDEESTFWEDIKIMISLFSFKFIKAFFKTL
ncbi:MAG: lycopene cyclase [Flavobacteriaceae bacterium]|nr:lycopene cyclase [Flavobacteriaceae bacterium]